MPINVNNTTCGVIGVLLDLKNHGAYLPVLVDNIPVVGQLHKRFIKLLYSIQKSDNNLTKLCLKLAIYGSSYIKKTNMVYMVTQILFYWCQTF